MLKPQVIRRNPTRAKATAERYETRLALLASTHADALRDAEARKRKFLHAFARVLLLVLLFTLLFRLLELF